MLDLYGFRSELSRIGFGRDDGRLWLGFSGSVQLVELLPVGAAVENARVLWDPSLDVTALTPAEIVAALSFELSGLAWVQYSMPSVLEFSGSAYLLNEGTIHRFGGDLRLQLPTVGLGVAAGLLVGFNMEAPPYPFLFLSLDVDLLGRGAARPVRPGAQGPPAWSVTTSFPVEPSRRTGPASLMLDNSSTRLAAAIELAEEWRYQLVEDTVELAVTFDALIEGRAWLDYRPEQVEGTLRLRASVGLTAPAVELGLSAAAELTARGPRPLVIDATVGVAADLPWPLPDYETELHLHWDEPIAPPVDEPLVRSRSATTGPGRTRPCPSTASGSPTGPTRHARR